MEFAEVAFKGTRKGYYGYETLALAPGDAVIVEADRGHDLGRITALGRVAERKCSSSGGCSTPKPEQQVLRRPAAGRSDPMGDAQGRRGEGPGRNQGTRGTARDSK